MITRTILANWMMVGAICTNLQASNVAHRTAASEIGRQQWSDPGVALLRAATNPFAGTYCGYLGNLYGSITISDGGSVSGSFSYWSPYYRESLSFSGKVTAAGAMSLKVVRSITVLDRSGRTGRTSTQRYSAGLAVALDANGNLVGTSGWGTPFVLSPCQ